MAFRKASGYTNLNSGNFSPVIYSKQVQLAFRKSTVCSEITNSDYFGEISGQGDSVRILKEPEISVSAYSRGTLVTTQDLTDADFTLTVDQANQFAFQIDDIEKVHANVDFMALASNRAGYRLKDQFDQDVLGYLSGYKQGTIHVNANTVNTTTNGTVANTSAGTDELLATMKLNKGSFKTITTSGALDHSIPVGPRIPGQTAMPTAFVSPAMLVARMSRLLDQQYVDRDGRWLVLDPVIMEVLQDEYSRLFDQDYGSSGDIRNGLVLKNFYGFTVYVSNNLPSVGNGPAKAGTANQNIDYGVIVAGHKSAVATAEQINDVESFRSQTTFADVVRGLQLYGRKILRPEALTVAKYNLA